MASAGSRQQWLKGMLEPSAPVDPAAAAAAVAEADRQRRRRRSLCIAALVLLALAGVGVLAGLLVKASLDRRGEQASADSGASALAAPTAAVPASDVVQLEGKDRFYWEAQAEHIQASRLLELKVVGRHGAWRCRIRSPDVALHTAALHSLIPPTTHPCRRRRSSCL